MQHYVKSFKSQFFGRPRSARGAARAFRRTGGRPAAHTFPSLAAGRAARAAHRCSSQTFGGARPFTLPVDASLRASSLPTAQPCCEGWRALPCAIGGSDPTASRSRAHQPLSSAVANVSRETFVRLHSISRAFVRLRSLPFAFARFRSPPFAFVRFRPFPLAFVRFRSFPLAFETPPYVAGSPERLACGTSLRFRREIRRKWANRAPAAHAVCYADALRKRTERKTEHHADHAG